MRCGEPIRRVGTRSSRSTPRPFRALPIHSAPWSNSAPILNCPKKLDIDPTFGVFFMTKYDEQLKLMLVRQYRTGMSGFRALAQKYGVSRSVLRRWVLAYERHGRDGLRRKSSQYDARFRMSVLSHMWKNGVSQEQLAAMFGIRSSGCIAKWERLYMMAVWMLWCLIHAGATTP
jgi:transposase-like protein